VKSLRKLILRIVIGHHPIPDVYVYDRR